MGTVVVAVHLLAVSTWVGSMVTIAVFARASRKLLDDRSRVALFASVGRTFAVVGPVALAVSLATGLIMAGVPSEWRPTVWAAGALGAATIVVAVVAMRQAHRMTGLRRRLAESGEGAEAVARGARAADGLRGLLGLLTLAALVVEAAAVVATH
ncbi:MAG TPA: hypothetical protein VHA73_08900 [Acidimicrobiales bacterium]|nr:hypothetical protein [Acidimicrobiales bacterium]